MAISLVLYQKIGPLLQDTSFRTFAVTKVKTLAQTPLAASLASVQYSRNAEQSELEQSQQTPGLPVESTSSLIPAS